MESCVFPPEVLENIMEFGLKATEGSGEADWFFNARDVSPVFASIVDRILAKEDDDPAVERALILHRIPREYAMEKQRQKHEDDEYDLYLAYKELKVMTTLTKDLVVEGDSARYFPCPGYMFSAFCMNGSNTAYVCSSDNYLQWVQFWPDNQVLLHVPLEDGGDALCVRGVSNMRRSELRYNNCQLEFNIAIVAQETTLSMYEFAFKDGCYSRVFNYDTALRFPPAASNMLNMTVYRYGDCRRNVLLVYFNFN